MPILIAPWLDVSVLPTSWKLRVLTQMLDRLDPVTAPVRRQRVEDLRAQVQITWEMELQWRSARASSRRTSRHVQPIDKRIDLCLGSMHEIVSRLERMEKPESAAHSAAQSFNKRFFPLGVGAVTNLSVDEELAVAQSIDAALHGELAQDVDLLGLTYWAAKLRELLPDYQAAVDSPTKRPIEFSEVQNARTADHEGVCRLIVYLLQHALQHPADADENMALLKLYNENVERVTSLRKSGSKTIPDVDPASGNLKNGDDQAKPS